MTKSVLHNHLLVHLASDCGGEGEGRCLRLISETGVGFDVGLQEVTSPSLEKTAISGAGKSRETGMFITNGCIAVSRPPAGGVKCERGAKNLIISMVSVVYRHAEWCLSVILNLIQDLRTRYGIVKSSKNKYSFTYYIQSASDGITIFLVIVFRVINKFSVCLTRRLGNVIHNVCNAIIGLWHRDGTASQLFLGKPVLAILRSTLTFNASRGGTRFDVRLVMFAACAGVIAACAGAVAAYAGGTAAYAYIIAAYAGMAAAYAGTVAAYAGVSAAYAGIIAAYAGGINAHAGEAAAYAGVTPSQANVKKSGILVKISPLFVKFLTFTGKIPLFVKNIVSLNKGIYKILTIILSKKYRTEQEGNRNRVFFNFMVGKKPVVYAGPELLPGPGRSIN